MPSKINNPLKYEYVPPPWTLKSFVTPHQPLKNDDHFIFKAGPHLDKCKLESWGLTHFATIFTLFWSKISESIFLKRIIKFSTSVRKKYLFVILHLQALPKYRSNLYNNTNYMISSVSTIHKYFTVSQLQTVFFWICYQFWPNLKDKIRNMVNF